MRCAFVVTLLLAGPALAQPAPHLEGEYGGVIAGQKSASSTRPAKPKKAPPKGTLTWVGFEATNGGAQVFLQSVEPFEATQRLEGSTLVVHLTLTRLGTNTWRPVDTRFFDNPLAGIVAKPARAAKGTKRHRARRRGIDVRIKFKNPKDAREATVRSSTEPDGMYYVYLTFPESADAGLTEPTPAAGDVEQ